MDWYLPGDDPSGLSALRRQIRSYLVRHAAPGSAVDEAELVVQELLANAHEHATGPMWVRLSWAAEEPSVEVWDLGPGFSMAPQDPPIPVEALDTSPGLATPYADAELPDLLAEGGRGLFLVSHLSSAFAVAARPPGGSHVTAQLPVRRATSPSFDPPPPVTAGLPDLDEANADGTFGRESFLRALVVQLSLAVEDRAGPDTSEGVVAQVGIGVGGQMEAAYRLAHDVSMRLTPSQLADCYVRLKHAIDGGFQVEEITDERIVLVNSRCPFGNAVLKAPALCRMTSSVFGGIAARNHDSGAAVVLEERIAVGDPGCRVVVHLGDPPESVRRFAHRYRSPSATDSSVGDSVGEPA